MILFDHISKYYGAQKAVDELSFTIAEGQVVGFLGPNGAGKSTSMKILTGFLAASSGQASIDGLDVGTHAKDLKQLVGYLPENNPLYTDMYVKEYLLYVAKTYRLGGPLNARVQATVDQVGLGREQHKRIGQLSKGYRQRVGLAQAIIHQPKVLVLDEPTSGLDPNQILEIRELIAQMGREKTVLLSTHILQEVEAICDRVLIIKNGRLVADGSTAELKKKSNSSYSISLELNNPLPIEAFSEIEGIDQIRQLSPTQWEIDSACELRPALFNLAVQHNNPILGLQQGQRSLEQFFREVTR